MKRTRTAPLLAGLTSTILVGVLVAFITFWSGSDENSHRAGPTPAAHHERTVESHTRIAYPVANADPKQNYGDLRLPADYNSRTDIPLVVMVHGGSWAKAISAHVFDRFARDLADRGIASYNIEYRRLGSGGGWTTTFTDVAAAFDEVPTILNRYPRLRPTGVTAVGHSSGAQLATWAGLRSPSDPGPGGTAPRFAPSRIVSISGPLDMVFAADNGDTRVQRVLGGTPFTVPERYRAVDPAQVAAARTDIGLPVVTAVAGTDDRLVSPLNTMRFVADYVARGGHANVHLMPGQTHNSMLKRGTAAYRELLALVVDSTRH